MSVQKQHHSFSYYKSSSESCATCVVSGCKRLGAHTVLLDPRNPKERVHMCLGHAKEHNKAIDYFKNMGTKEIEAEVKADTIWRLPTWPLKGDYRRCFVEKNVFNLFDEHSPYVRQKETVPFFPQEVEKAAKTMGVGLPILLPELKKVYKTKVKQFHPDLN